MSRLIARNKTPKSRQTLFKVGGTLKLCLLALSGVGISDYAYADNNPAANVQMAAESIASTQQASNASPNTTNNAESSQTSPAPVVGNGYIGVNNYIMNPYNHSPSGGGTQVLTTDDLLNKTPWQEFFTNGTYNIVGLASWTMLNQGSNNYAYGTNIFAQSGHVDGFAVGGMLEAVNPFLQPGYRYLSGPISYATLPNNQVLTPSELYLEYQLPNQVQVDAGWIFLETPWMNSYDDSMLVSGDFQGAVVNYQLSQNWRLEAIATNAYQEFGSNSFNQLTVYNQEYNGNGWKLPDNVTTDGSYALGGVYKPNDNYELNMWAYSFSGYANTLYADSTYVKPLNADNKIYVGTQIGNQNTWGMNTNVMQQAGYGSPDSYLAGAKVGYNYDQWFNEELSFDGMYGPDNSFYQGGFVSPYTYIIANDPLYTTSLAGGLVEQGAGNSWRAATTFKPLGDDLKIELAFEQFITASPLNSYDLDIKYKPFYNSLRGLILHFEMNYTAGPSYNTANAGDFLYIQTIASYNF